MLASSFVVLEKKNIKGLFTPNLSGRNLKLDTQCDLSKFVSLSFKITQVNKVRVDKVSGLLHKKLFRNEILVSNFVLIFSFFV